MPSAIRQGRVPAEIVKESLARRAVATDEFFTAEAARIARLCHVMAERFERGGRLLALGPSPAALSDARHVAVEFVHPVIVGKRSLPALAIAGDGGALPAQIALLARPEDIVLTFAASDGGETGEARAALALARGRGCLTIACSPCGAEWELAPPSENPFVRQELTETLYHMLWELVHVLLEHPGLISGRSERPTSGGGEAGFLYPFLTGSECDLPSVLEHVRRSVLAKAEEITTLRTRTVDGSHAELVLAASVIRSALEGGGALLVFGNGGSATDAMDLVADFRAAPQGWAPRRAIDLTADPAILTAIANDVGTDAVFARQVIAYGRAGDVALALSTSGSSRNVVLALGEARRRQLATIAFVGDDGGRILSERLADIVIRAPSPYVPRVQEAQAAAYHILRELVELAAA